MNALTIAAALLVASAADITPSPIAPVGTDFKSLTVSEALAMGREQKRLVVVLVFARWCESCQKLSREILENRRGGVLSARAVCTRIDFDAPESRAIVERHSVISLPTLLVLRGDGSEVGRIEGYDRARSFIAEANALLDGQDSLKACEGRLATSRDDVKALFCVGKAYLDRGRVEEALPLLEEVLVRDPRNRAKVTDQALFVMGRYFARVRQLPRPARHYFRELDARFPNTPYGSGAAWWYARSLHKIDKTELGYLYLEQRARRLGSASAVAELGRFSILAEFRQEETVRHVRKGLRRAPGNRELKEILEKLEPVAGGGVPSPTP